MRNESAFRLFSPREAWAEVKVGTRNVAMKTTVILFDAAGVLFPLNKVVGEELQRAFGLDETKLKKFWHDGLYRRLTVGEINTQQFLAAFADEFNLPKEKVTQQLF